MGRIEILFNGISSRLDDDAESIEASEAGYSGTDPVLSYSSFIRLSTCETGSLETAPTATQSCRCSHFWIARGLPPISSLDSSDFSGYGRGAGELSRAWGKVAAGVRVIVSRARFGGPGF